MGRSIHELLGLLAGSPTDTVEREEWSELVASEPEDQLSDDGYDDLDDEAEVAEAEPGAAPEADRELAGAAGIDETHGPSSPTWAS